MKTVVLFIHGAGKGAYEEDALLAASLQKALGPDYEVRYPRMPTEDSSTYADWKAPIETELAHLEKAPVLVGHSVGGSVLLKYMSEKKVSPPVADLFVMAAPFWGADAFWTWKEAQLPADLAARLKHIPHIFLYHCRDDEVVPFGHLSLYAARLPNATFREVEEGGHQFAGDLAEIGRDIIRAASTPRG